jgi:A/G-specific adenine glycosylase
VDTSAFQELLWQKGHELYRDMPWRHDTRPYYVLVSELMLQQTQVDRVIPKFNAFIQAFPSEAALADASLAQVVTLWQGLGYNRRAKFLHEAAKMVVAMGSFPDDEKGLLGLPGVGKNTMGAIRAYAYNQPALFVETNVRTVYFHHFFADGNIVDDAQVLKLVAQTIDHEHPREFYWALMDYGSWLKRQGVGKIIQSKHYKKQSPLKGSVREVRGQIIKHLTINDASRPQLEQNIVADDRFELALTGLVRDGLVTTLPDGRVHLTK